MMRCVIVRTLQDVLIFFLANENPPACLVPPETFRMRGRVDEHVILNTLLHVGVRTSGVWTCTTIYIGRHNLKTCIRDDFIFM